MFLQEEEIKIKDEVKDGLRLDKGFLSLTKTGILGVFMVFLKRSNALEITCAICLTCIPQPCHTVSWAPQFPSTPCHALPHSNCVLQSWVSIS